MADPIDSTSSTTTTASTAVGDSSLNTSSVNVFAPNTEKEKEKDCVNNNNNSEKSDTDKILSTPLSALTEAQLKTLDLTSLRQLGKKLLLTTTKDDEPKIIKKIIHLQQMFKPQSPSRVSPPPPPPSSTVNKLPASALKPTPTAGNNNISEEQASVFTSSISKLSNTVTNLINRIAVIEKRPADNSNIQPSKKPRLSILATAQMDTPSTTRPVN
eukprot:TRINITY_DN7950_c0_g1_i1.p1 TRINITY_DN7950_c0_g1~~TRINITY_DN7950_c0_g1_i1.p1  ORF type:complete len:214 (+),score=54.03 TRINITY_DN7950_c0_g1_i1:299-940(+)